MLSVSAHKKYLAQKVAHSGSLGPIPKLKHAFCSLIPRPILSFSMFHAEKWEGLVCEITRQREKVREGPGRLAGQRSMDFGAIQLTINERYDYIAVIRVKGDPLSAQKVQLEFEKARIA